MMIPRKKSFDDPPRLAGHQTMTVMVCTDRPKLTLQCFGGFKVIVRQGFMIVDLNIFHFHFSPDVC